MCLYFKMPTTRQVQCAASLVVWEQVVGDLILEPVKRQLGFTLDLQHLGTGAENPEEVPTCLITLQFAEK